MRLETDDEVVARQPLSVGTLLELRAVAAEDATFKMFLPTLSEDERIVDRTLYTRDLLQHLYDPMLTTYSAAAHVLATSSGQTNAAAVFAWGAALADICTIVDTPTVRELRPPSQLTQLGHGAIHGFRSRSDPGFIYGCVIAWVHGNHGIALDANALQTALRGVGLPIVDEVYRRAQRSMFRRATPHLRSERLRGIRTALREAGLAILRAKSMSSGLLPQASWGELPAPMVMTSDCEQFHLGQVVVGVEDAEWLHSCQCRLDSSLRQALRAGRGLDFGFTDFIY